MTTAAVIYARISKDEAGEGLGVDRQEKACRDLAKKQRLDVVEVIVDNDASAYAKRMRPGFERLVGMLRRGEVGALVVYHADRLYRRAPDLERLVTIVEETGVRVHTVAAGEIDLTTASGRMIARMLGAAAQAESERMGERLRLKSDELAKAGKAPGGRTPFGYRRDAQRYVVNPTEAEAVRFMARRIREGASCLGVARELDAQGISTREGRPWHSSTVRASLVNPAVVGLRIHRREVAGPGDWEPILDRQTWEEVRATLQDPARRRRRPANSYVLSGLVETVDGCRMNGCPDVQQRRTYASRWPASTMSSIGADVLEEAVIGAVFAALDGVTLPVVMVPTPKAADELEAVEEEMRQLAALRGEGTITMEEWLAARGPLQERLDALKGTALPTSSVAHLLTKPGAVAKEWERLSDAQRRDILSLLIERVVIGPAERGRWSTLEERLDADRGWGIVWRR